MLSIICHYVIMNLMLRLKLREIRESRFLTQRELSKRANVGLSTIVRLERGYQSPTFQTVKKLADALGIHPSQLVHRKSTSARKRKIQSTDD